MNLFIFIDIFIFIFTDIFICIFIPIFILIFLIRCRIVNDVFFFYNTNEITTMSKRHE